MIFSDHLIAEYSTILSNIVNTRVEKTTQLNMATDLGVGLSTIKEFESGKIIRFDILEQYLAILSNKKLLILTT